MSEQLKCTLCAMIESPGFYTGCMINDGLGQSTEFDCDGKGNITRRVKSTVEYECRCHGVLGVDFWFLPKGSCLFEKCDRWTDRGRQGDAEPIGAAAAGPHLDAVDKAIVAARNVSGARVDGELAAGSHKPPEGRT